MELAIYAVICSLLMLVGLIGIFAPVLPGIPIAWLGLFIYAIGTGFERISVVTIIVFAAITALILILDALAPMLGAKKISGQQIRRPGRLYRLDYRRNLPRLLGDYPGPLPRGFPLRVLSQKKSQRRPQGGPRHLCRLSRRRSGQSNLSLHYGRLLYRLFVLSFQGIDNNTI
jgi:hypothetical protein